MPAFTRAKLAEAKFFLDRLQGAATDFDPFYYNLSAFLSAWRSTLDIMLYDFVEIFPLGFTREDAITKRDFKVAARAAQNSEAERFITWWDNQQSVLGSTPLWKKRNLNVHRGPVGLARPPQFTVLVTGSGGTSSTIHTHNIHTGGYASHSISSLTTQGAISPSTFHTHTINTDEYASHSISSLTTQGVGVSNIWHFTDLPNDNAIEVCTQAYAQIEDIVEEAESSFHVHL